MYKGAVLFYVVAAFADPAWTYDVLSYNSFLVPKSYLAANFILFGDQIAELGMRAAKWLRARVPRIVIDEDAKKTPAAVETEARSGESDKIEAVRAVKIEGVPLIDVINYAFDLGSFPVTDACDHFGISKEKHQKIATLLEDSGLLVRGLNNARVINEDADDAHILALVKSAAGESVDALVKT